MSRGNSFANGATSSGASVSNGNSMANGPGAAEWAQGWWIRPVSCWDFMEGCPLV